jgi:secreted trypsin-like serine protease
MRRLSFVLSAALLLNLFAVTKSSSITFGESDEGRHPNVGALSADFDGTGTKFAFCTGTLVAPKVVLTAAHCLDFLPSYGISTVYVSFNQTFDQSNTFYSGSYIPHPEYGKNQNDPKDIGVILLNEEPLQPGTLTPLPLAKLPQAGLLDSLKAQGTLKNQVFTAVGYGQVRETKRLGPRAIMDNANRNMVLQTFQALNKAWLRLSQNPSTGDGGTCYGDSGGPHFLGSAESDMIVAITSTGDTVCRATDVDYRLDTPSARDFLQKYGVPLP